MAPPEIPSASGKTSVSTAPKAGTGLFAALFGGWLGLSLLKFGNPIILDKLIQRPHGIWERIFQPWPVAWGYELLVPVALCGIAVWKAQKKEPLLLFLMPLAWLAWQFAASLKTVSSELTNATLWHFSACCLCFYLGAFALSQCRNLRWFWTLLFAAFFFVLWIGFDQHNGGLEETRKHFYATPGWRNYPPELLKKMESDRIFSTLVYPNALAGVILMLGPALLFVFFQATQKLPRILGAVAFGLVAYGAAACLVWSGSKAGLLIALLLVLATVLHVSFSRTLKTAIVAVVLIGGLAAFFLRFNSYFQKGATSVSARFDYWTAAVETFKENPVFGTGPGTFSIPYKKIKPPEAEMARLTHNDYLQQASDSGVPGFLTYFPIFLGSLGLLYRGCAKKFPEIDFWIWLGLLGWAAQGFMEFGLYIPALAWPAFALLGWLWGRNPMSERA